MKKFLICSLLLLATVVVYGAQRYNYSPHENDVGLVMPAVINTPLVEATYLVPTVTISAAQDCIQTVQMFTMPAIDLAAQESLDVTSAVFLWPGLQNKMNNRSTSDQYNAITMLQQPPIIQYFRRCSASNHISNQYK